MTLIEIGGLASALIALLTILQQVLGLVTQIHDLFQEVEVLTQAKNETLNQLQVLKSHFTQVECRLNRIESYLEYLINHTNLEVNDSYVAG